MKVDPDILANKLFKIVLFGAIAFIAAAMVVVNMSL